MFIGLPMIAGFVPFGLTFTNSNTFHVNKTCVHTIGVCNQMVFDCLIDYRRENGGKENKRKTKTDDAGLDEGRWLWKGERRGQTTNLGGREPEEEYL